MTRAGNGCGGELAMALATALAMAWAMDLAINATLALALSRQQASEPVRIPETASLSPACEHPGSALLI